MIFIFGYILALLFGGICAYYTFYVLKYCINPYTTELVVGSKGSGKSLYMARVANEWFTKHKGDIYSNMGIGYPLPDNYWEYDFPPDSLILIDEVGVLHPDRGYKTFPPACAEWYKMARKRRLTILLSSQVMDVDKKIRMLCDKIYVCKKYGFLCRMRPYAACISMVDTPEGGHDLVNDLKRKGRCVWYSIPKTALVSEKIGYDTAQLVEKENARHARRAAKAVACPSGSQMREHSGSHEQPRP